MKVEISVLPWMALLLCMTCQILGYCVFLRGFLALRTVVPGHASWLNASIDPEINTNIQVEHDDHQQTLPPIFGRLVFVLIDALRADFVLPVPQSNVPRMKFVGDLINQNKTLSFLARAHPPTVTLPRLKALTTGGIPGFVDVVLNFDSAALQEDNLIYQFHHGNKDIVFYGDDTWMRLFPDKFKRTDGTTSFFVTDYTEVDDNVTRHLAAELGSNDWDVMVLHYLGLDHIGHLAGPFSPLVAPKLTEMDDVIKYIHQSLAKQDKLEELPSLLVLCGDHGMSDHGSHGGSSGNEVNTPLIFMSSLWEHGTGAPYRSQLVDQVDAVPTLAQMMGVPIPQNSLGVTIPLGLQTRPLRQQLAALHLNSQQFLQVFQHNVPTYQGDAAYVSLQHAIAAHRSWLTDHLGGSTEARLGQRVRDQYVQAMRAMRNRVSASLTKYDLHAMVSGIVLLWLALVSLVLGLVTMETRPTQSLSLSSVSVFLVSVGLLTTIQVLQCTSTYRSPFLCCGGYCHVSLAVGLVVMGAACISLIFTYISSLATSRLKDAVLHGGFLWQFLLVGTVAHTVSLMASSFVEEEHQTWYFLTLTAQLLFAYSLVVRGPHCTTAGPARTHPDCTTAGPARTHPDCTTAGPARTHPDCTTAGPARTHPDCTTARPARTHPDCTTAGPARTHPDCTTARPARTRRTQTDQTGSNWTGDDFMYMEKEDCQYDGSRSGDTTQSDGGDVGLTTRCYNKVYLSLAMLGVGILSRSLRAWNRTGDKWAHLADVGDWLVRPENKIILSVLTVTSLVVVCAVRCRGAISWRYRVLLLGGAVSVYCFRSANGTLCLLGFYHGAINKGLWEARLTYAILAVMLVDTLVVSVLADRGRCGEREVGRRAVTGVWWLPWSVKIRGQGVSLRTDVITRLQAAWTLAMLLLLRPHNTALVAMETVLELFLSYLCGFYKDLSLSSITLLYVWMGQASFFYQGNSNSISTVDVSAGYVGVGTYQPALIGALLAAVTYGGPVLWAVSLARVVSREVDGGRWSSWSRAMDVVCFTVIACRTLPLAFYTSLVTIQRFHLFVWTVFSPKLLYEGVHTLVTTAVVLAMLTSRRLLPGFYPTPSRT